MTPCKELGIMLFVVGGVASAILYGPYIYHHLRRKHEDYMQVRMRDRLSRGRKANEKR